ncbi:EAL domain-containing protein [Sphingomonas fuzhouensis]|uniref:EAL domain-containing protein n=1 Tax=Sphingomonas fuzhouensis TaxID=3106033 RepID=UPI002AFE0CF5|nr:EAL domain-containing protein [Sphingomonas sp. SGZ-02]
MQPGYRSFCPEHPAFAIAMAFQPIMDVETGRPIAYEALVRGRKGEGAADILASVKPEERYDFDQQCRVAAIEGAVAAGLLDSDARLSINFFPDTVYSPLACLEPTLDAARRLNLPYERLIFEFSEQADMGDGEHLKTILDTYHHMGFGTAIDDFGAGHAGLTLLGQVRTDYIKLDMALIRGINQAMPRRMIVEGVIRIAEKMGIAIIAEGVETIGEYDTLHALGVRYMQGYLIARPGFRCLPPGHLPEEPSWAVSA